VRRTDFNRREFCTLTASAVASLAFGASCKYMVGSLVPNDGRLSARPHDSIKTTATGELRLGLVPERDAILHIPQTNGNQSALPLFVMLHGATQSAEDMFWYLGNANEEAGVVVLAPNSRDTTWDAIGGSFGPDVAFLNRALQRVFDIVQIDPARIAIGGFSDGASYGLSLGLINGDLFSRVIAFSPGFVVDGTPNSKPKIFISHGTNDHILPIDRCGRRVAAELKDRGYEVTFREFEGDHEIPADVAREGLRFL